MTVKLLAGPILRRTTKNRVCVWLATERQSPLHLTVTNRNGQTVGQSDLADLAEQHVQLGENLWVYLLQARPEVGTTFPADELLCYQLAEAISPENIQPLDLTDLAYGDLKHPSFVIIPTMKHLLHGSCRKPHGGYDKDTGLPVTDALSHGHTLLDKTWNNLEQRPSVLLLTGDQIYADDVAISLLAMLREQAVTITGKQETLPVAEHACELPPLNPREIPLDGRKLALKEKYRTSTVSEVKIDSGFSSEASENHLFTFGEFATMYIYAFGNFPNWQPVWGWEELEKLGIIDCKENLDENKDPHKKSKKKWADQEQPLQTFHNTLPNIRKLLANISTYMIFDDHDVTDDWNITGDWYEGVRDSPMGRRIVSNALAAYWAFQAWGNDPDNFDKDFHYSITNHLNNDKCSGDIGERYDLHTWKSRGWGFSIPTEPPIIAMDSRTQRQYENQYYPAVLLDRYALDWLRVEWAKLKTSLGIDANTACPVFIATTPVIGFSTIEHFQQLGLWLAGLVESWKPIHMLEKIFDKEGFLTGWMVNKLDAESWSSNKDGYLALMDTLSQRMGIKQCVFLSGDVHYAFTTSACFKHQNRKLHCYQLTSSSLSNEPNPRQFRVLNNMAKHNVQPKPHRNWALLPKQRWVTILKLLEAENTGFRVTADCNLGLVEFANGVVVSHTLLTQNRNLVYRLSLQTDDVCMGQ